VEDKGLDELKGYRFLMPWCTAIVRWPGEILFRAEAFLSFRFQPHFDSLLTCSSISWQFSTSRIQMTSAYSLQANGRILNVTRHFFKPKKAVQCYGFIGQP
jgi:hypothetical protein